MGVHQRLRTIPGTNLLRWLPRSLRLPKFAGQVLTLMSGTLLAQCLVVLCAPILTRLYNPSDFAVYALYATAANLISGVAAGRYEFAIMLPRHQRAAGHLVALGLILSAMTAMAAFTVVAAIRSGLVGQSTMTRQLEFLWLVPGGVLFYSWYSVLTQWHSRNLGFKHIAGADICASVGAITIQVGTAFLFRNVDGFRLIHGMIFGQALAVVFLFCTAMPRLFPTVNRFSWRLLSAQAKRHWRFPAYSTSSALLSKGTHEAPKLMLATLFTPEVLGLYTLAMRVVGIPVTLVAQSVGKVFFPKIAESRHDPTRSRRLLLKATGALLLLILAPMTVLFFWAEPIFALAFGPQWVDAGHYCRLLIPFIIGRFVVSPIGLSMMAFEKQRVVMVWNASYLVLVPLSFLAGAALDSAAFGIGCFSFASLGMYTLYLLMSLYSVSHSSSPKTRTNTAQDADGTAPKPRVTVVAQQAT